MANVNAKIKFSGIEILSKKLEARAEDENVPPKDFDYNISATSTVNQSIKAVFVKVDIKIKEETKKNYTFEISLLCGFEIENFDSVIEKKTDTFFLIPPELDALLKSVSVSTTRGVIFSELRGTLLLHATLPIIMFTPEQIEIAQQQQFTTKEK